MPTPVWLTVDEVLDTILPADMSNVDMSGFVAMAELQINSDDCPKLRSQMVAYLAVHLAIESNRSLGASGEIETYKEGGVAIKYSSTGKESTIPGLSSTTFGKEYDRLRRICTFSPMTSLRRVDAESYIRQGLRI